MVVDKTVRSLLFASNVFHCLFSLKIGVFFVRVLFSEETCCCRGEEWAFYEIAKETEEVIDWLFLWVFFEIFPQLF